MRIYFGTRSTENRSSIGYLEAAAAEPAEVKYVHDQPVLSPGQLGTFDDGGVGPYALVEHGGSHYLYYGGINAGITVPYRNAIGVAVSHDGGRTFERVFLGPIVDRTAHEPYFVAAADVRIESGTWRMWYGSCTGWTVVDGRPESQYQIKYAESSDGLTWRRENVTCIEYATPGEANVRPCIVKDGATYRMWYCFRGSVGYRSSKDEAYRLGYAESSDGVSWVRKDGEVGIDRSESGWDSVMMCYPYLYEHDGTRYLLYNGNGFGESGFGYAVSEAD